MNAAKSKNILMFVMFAIIGANVLLAVYSLQSRPAAVVVRSEGKVSNMDGDIYSTGQKLYANERFKMEAGGSLDLIYPNGTLVRFKDADSKLIACGKEIKIRLRQGSVFSRVKPGTPYEISTPVGVAGAKGTEFAVEHQTNTYVCVCEGVVEVWKHEAPTIRKEIKADEDLWIKSTAPLGTPKVTPEMTAKTKAEFSTLIYEPHNSP